MVAFPYMFKLESNVTLRLIIFGWAPFLFLDIPPIVDISSWIIEIDNLGVVSDSGCIVWNIFGDNTAGTDCDIASNRNVFDNAHIGSNIGVVAYNRRMAVVAANCRELR